MSFDPGTGVTQVTDCECRGPEECHVEGQPNNGVVCVGPNVNGTTPFPPACAYTGDMTIVNGLPLGTTIEIDFSLGPIMANVVTVNGGPLGGETTMLDWSGTMTMTGTGSLAGFNRILFPNLSCLLYTAPRIPGTPIQTFITDFETGSAMIFGDPDFCTFELRIGDTFTLPSPGQTTFTRLGGPGSNFNIDSFFDLTYEIEFVGCPGSLLEGFGGITQDTTRIQAGAPLASMPFCTGDCPPGMKCEQTLTFNSSGLIDVCCDCVPDPSAGFPTHCNGDGGDQLGCTNCPCNNNAPIGTIGGCLNSANTSARLIASGDPSVSLPAGSNADLRFSLSGAPANAFCILNAGDAVAPQNIANPCFGANSGVQAIVYDGLRCVIENTRRHGGRSADFNGDVGVTNNPWGGEGGPNIGIAAAGSYIAGQTRFFQVVNRDDVTLSCMRGLNTSQAIEVTFTL